MEKYRINDNTLFHSVFFNIPKIESIMKYGILSEKYASEKGVNYARNYYGYNLDDTISMTRYLYVNYNIEDSSYCRYIKNGVGFIVENTPFISNKDERIIHRSDEVLVESYIPVDNIKGIMIPSNYEDTYLSDLQLIDYNMKDYVNAKNNCNYVVEYLTKNGYDIDIDEYSLYLKDLKNINKEISKYKDSNLSEEDINYKDAIEDFKDCLNDTNAFLAYHLEEYFKNILDKDNVTLMEAITYLNDKYLKLPLYNIPSDSINKKR